MVVGVAALAANQGIVLLAKHALTDAEFDGSHHISDCSLDLFHTAADREEEQSRPGGAAGAENTRM
jgi:hypothetical protein